jgi:hypothetical protein
VDQLYYALVDLSSHGIRPPILALNAILLSSGYVASLDRAFSLLQEYHQLFHIKPSLESYCALVHAVGRATSTPPRVSVVVAVLQEMDSNDFQPNSYCYSILIEVILITEEEDHIKGIPGILSHMDDNAIQPSLRCLRRLAIFYAKRGNEEMVTEVSIFPLRLLPPSLCSSLPLTDLPLSPFCLSVCSLSPLHPSHLLSLFS